MAGKMWVNGALREMLPEEAEAAKKQAAISVAREKIRPMTETEVSRMLIAAQINTLDVDDSTALRMRASYPVWAAGNAYPAGYKVQHGGKLWRTLQAHTGQAGWEPGTAASLWEQVSVTHSGELSDPICYEGNMRLDSGKYYLQDGTVYLCIRDSGSPVHHALTDLVGLYVEIA